jgi:hypothetical protein
VRYRVSILLGLLALTTGAPAQTPWLDEVRALASEYVTVESLTQQSEGIAIMTGTANAASFASLLSALVRSRNGGRLTPEQREARMGGAEHFELTIKSWTRPIVRPDPDTIGQPRPSEWASLIDQPLPARFALVSQ